MLISLNLHTVFHFARSAWTGIGIVDWEGVETKNPNSPKIHQIFQPARTPTPLKQYGDQ